MSDLLIAAAEKVGLPVVDFKLSANGDGVVAVAADVPVSCVVLGDAVVCADVVISGEKDSYVEIRDSAIVKGGTIGKFAKVCGTAIVMPGAVIPDYGKVTSGVLVGTLPVMDAGKWKAGLCGPGIAWIGCVKGDKAWWAANLEAAAKENGVGDQIEYYRGVIADLFALPSPFEVA